MTDDRKLVANTKSALAPLLTRWHDFATEANDDAPFRSKESWQEVADDTKSVLLAAQALVSHLEHHSTLFVGIVSKLAKADKFPRLHEGPINHA